MTTLQFSENLYPIDEVFITFTQCLIKKADLNECLFWLFEIEASSKHVVQGLWCIYNQFYCLGNIGLNVYIANKIKKYKKDNDIIHLCGIVCNLRHAMPSIVSYKICNECNKNNGPNTVYRNYIMPENIDKRYYGLLSSIEAGNIVNIGSYLSSFDNMDDVYNVCLKLFALKNICLADIDYRNTKDPIDIFHIAALISRAWNYNNHKNTKKMLFVAVNSQIVNNMKHHFTKKSNKSWKKLTEKRLHATHKCLGPSYYSRQCVDIVDASRYHWEYYAYDSKNWNNRFKKFGGVQNHDTKIVDFPNDEMLEAFYEDDNSMDFDEQPIETQLMSNHAITIIEDVDVWFNGLINENITNNFNKLKL